MRFGFLAAGFGVAGFIVGYGWPHDAPDSALAHTAASALTETPALAAQRIEPEQRSQPGVAPDLLEALKPSLDPAARGERILAAIEALEAPAIGALLRQPRSAEFQRLLEEMPQGWRGAILDQVMKRWLELDPASARTWLPEAPACFPSSFKNNLDQCVFHLLHPIAERFPEDAVAFALGTPPGIGRRNDLARSVIETVASKDRVRARELAERFTDEATKEAALEGYWRGFARADVFAALAEAKTLGSGLGRATVLNAIDAETSTPRQARELCDLLDEKECEDWIERYARVNSAAATRLIEQFVARPGVKHPPGLWLVASWFSRSDGGRGIEWAAGLPEPVRARALHSVAEYWAESQPAAVVARLGEILPEGSERTAALAGAMKPWLADDPTAALAWLDALPPGERRTALERVAIEKLPAHGRAEEALARFSQLPPPPFGEIDTSGATEELARRDPRRLAEWCMYFSHTGHPFPSLGHIVSGWFERDPATVNQWVAALPPGVHRDEAAAGCAQAASSVDAALAIEWLTWVADPRRRREAAATVEQIWKKRDPHAARAWREQFDLQHPP